MSGASESSGAILARIAASFPRSIDLSLRPAYYDLLRALGDPHAHMPPVLHVAGTNGKGSTCAFLRAILEAAGYRAHVYTSPHLVRFHERIRIAGAVIGEAELTALLLEAEAKAAPGQISQFELATAAAFTGFARHDADFTILETGLGGRNDATNVIAKPLAAAITRVSFDHRDYLGTTLAAIAAEKAGIMKAGVPCFVGSQAAAAVEAALVQEAARREAPLLRFGQDWRVDPAGGKAFRYSDRQGVLELPLPGLIGAHQIANASLALAMLRLGAGLNLGVNEIGTGLQKVDWPARLQKLKAGPLCDEMPKRWELWLDGGHNDSGGEVLAAQAESWRHQDGDKPRPLFIVCGMMNTKQPREFLTPLAPAVAALRAVKIPDEPNAAPLADLVLAARDAGINDAAAGLDLRQAVLDLSRQSAAPARVLICGSLHLAGHVLKDHA